MPKAHPSSSSSSSKKKQTLVKKRKKAHTANQKTQESLSYVCNVAGFNDGVLAGGSGNDANHGGLSEDNVMDCLDELASAQVVGTTQSSLSAAADSSKDDNSGNKINDDIKTASQSSSQPPPPPPRIDQIPNLRIELARHLQTQTLSTFLLQSCPGKLRMPTFERWLLDSKLEETDRYASIMEEWIHDPSSKMEYIAAMKEQSKKKKYGRAAIYQQRNEDAKNNSNDAQHEKEMARRDQECKMVWNAQGRILAAKIRRGDVGAWLRHIDRDPILPSRAMESDPSCERLLAEIVAALRSATPSTNSSNEGETTDYYQRGGEIVRELCRRSTEACKELSNLEQRLGRYQKFGWDTAIEKKKKRKRGAGSSSGGGNVDKIHVEWHKEEEEEEDGTTSTGDSSSLQDQKNNHHKLCSLVYVPKKRKSSSSRSSSGDPTEEEDGNTTHNGNKPKPFVIKLNSSHYHKLRIMFDATHNNNTSSSSFTKEQMDHIFHATLFAMVIRYSSLAGGQQLNDWRGGGMQGAIHDGVFDCLSKWFGGGKGKEGGSVSSSGGTECFASPFNSTISRFYSAFPSPDIDGHFGSHGDFFHPPSSESDFLRPGWYELNPPFSPGVMAKMAQRVTKLLNMSCEQNLDVAFVVVIPTVRTMEEEEDINAKMMKKRQKKNKKKKKKRHKDADAHDDDDNSSKEESNNRTSIASIVHTAASHSFHKLVNSPHCKSHIVLPAREHGYIEGGQHLRPTKFKESQYSTSVIVLRSKGWNEGGGSNEAELFEKEIREAFASRHAMEVEQRREKKKSLAK